MPDRLHQVCLAETRPAADEEGVVLPRGLVGHAKRGGVGETVRFARDEVLEGVGRVQAAGAAARFGRHAEGLGGRGVVAVGDEADLPVAVPGLLGGLGDLGAERLRDVVDVERGPDVDDDRLGRFGSLPRIPKPGLEVALVDAALEVLEDLGPGVGLFHRIFSAV